MSTPLLPNVPPISPDFSEYLKVSKDQPFVLDLSESTLLEVIEERIKMKQIISPMYGKGLNFLKKHLKVIEEKYQCTLMPVQITDIFWHHFTGYLLGEGISISSIKTMFSQLKSALSWGSRHRAVIAPSYDIFSLPSYQNQQVAMTLDDVSRIYHFDISTIPRRKQFLRHMDRVRDIPML